MRVGLVGCVKSKQSHAAQVRDLYTSPLFRGRRAYVERTCDQWFVLSALHGVLDPDQVIEPYERTLTTMGVRERRRWGDDAVKALASLLGPLGNHVFEIHAGAAYRDFGLVEGLRRASAAIEIPAEGLSQGRQLALYARANRGMTS